MKDKRITQISLPLIYHPDDAKNHVKQHWNITFARQKKVSVVAKRIMSKVMAMIRDDDNQLRPYYQMKVTDVAPSNSDISSLYKEMKKAFDELTDLKWLIEDIEKQRFHYRHLLNTSDANCGYKDGIITVVLNPVLKPYFIELAHYTTYELKHYMHFSSWYSMRMFELLSAFKDTGIMEKSISDLRQLLDCENKYPNANDFIKYTLAEPLEELEKTPLAFSYETILDKTHRGRGRKPIWGVRFTLKNVVPNTIPKEWYQYSDEHKNILNLLKNRWKISEKNITKYIKAIGMERAKELQSGWYKRMGTDDPIKDPAAFCTVVWRAEGEKAILKKEQENG